MRNTSVKAIAFGGMLSAVCVGIMCMGTLIPLATFICPVLVTLTGYGVIRFCGRKIAWCWYAAVAILSALLAPDKEAAALFIFIGYYPFVKLWFDRYRLGWLGKLLLFNCAIGLMYFLLLRLSGMADLAEEYAQLGIWGSVIMLLLGNATFFLVDRLLSLIAEKMK